jgi:hypothetical protein
MFFDPAVRSLKNGVHRWFYFTAYCAAVEARSETLPAKYTVRSLADRAGIDPRSAEIARKNAVEVGLFTERADGLIHVEGVRRNHVKLDWQEYGETSPHGADTGGKRGEEKSEKKSEERSEAKASLRVPKAHAPPSPSRAGECVPVEQVLAHVIPAAAPAVKQAPAVEEVEPTQADIEARAKKVAGWGVNELVCYVAKGSQKAGLTDTLNDALGRIPEPRLRELCCYVMAKADHNGWRSEQMAAVLTQRCKALMEGTAA